MIKSFIRERMGQIAFFVLFLIVFSFPLYVQASGQNSIKNKNLSEPEKRWGIKIESVRPTAGGRMLDFRFRVLDPSKARDLLSKGKKAFIVDQKRGKKLPVPVTKTGPLRQTTLKPQAGRIYFVLFANGNGLVQEGDKVTVVIGDFRAENILVASSGMKPSSSGMKPPELSESQRKKWQKIKKRQNVLLRDYQVCLEHCADDPSCVGRCEKMFKNRLESEYQRLINK